MMRVGKQGHKLKLHIYKPEDLGDLIVFFSFLDQNQFLTKSINLIKTNKL